VHSKSCHLAARWVEPNYLPYEPEDHTFMYDKDAYQNYRANVSPSPPTASKRPNEVPDADREVGASDTTMPPPIELVCRRLTIKFAPFLYLVYRYVRCRCVIWRSTPSRIVAETTILRHTDCPRHNRSGNTWRDYGTYSPCETDPNFEYFGGYAASWALLQCHLPAIFESLDGADAISKQEHVKGHIANSEKRPEEVEKLVEGYWFNVLKTCRLQYQTFPPGVEDQYILAKLKRDERGIDTASMEDQDTDDVGTEFYRKQFSEFVMGRELHDIMSKRWTGQPHWELKG
jgi:hypothetical protein